MANDLVTTAISLPEDTRRSQSRERVTRHRRRIDAGEFCVTLQLPAAETEDLLVELGLLCPELADDRAAVRDALERFVRGAIIDGASSV
ncbi:hypothetical protein [Hyphomicrobium sp. MC1]|uniref:hypothetical protein n=1 Tax=Hyphomicrobium sp. (strain MC1) TaxID=717785 RepID=UPI0002E2813D|nr:hypothetical protein [Hyphomicrobium sp. MC1]